MKTIKVGTSEDSVTVVCPHCDNWEETGIDDPRKSLTYIPILQFLKDKNGFELSKHNCTDCNNDFIVEWDYENKIT